MNVKNGPGAKNGRSVTVPRYRGKRNLILNQLWSPARTVSMRLDAVGFAQLRQLLRFAERAERGLRLRIGHDQMPPRFGHAIQRHVDFESAGLRTQRARR